MDSLSKNIRDRIVSGGTDKMYTVGDFADLCNDSVVTRTLSRMTGEGILIRLSQGLYLYPEKTRYGVKMPTAYEIAAAIAKRDNSKIIPSGLTVLNELGLSTQIPMKMTYLTDGTTRTIKLGRRSIVLKHSVPRTFAYKSDTFPKVVLAMKEIGQSGITEEILNSIQTILSKDKNPELVREDYNIAPQWIRKCLTPSQATTRNENNNMGQPS